MSDDARLRLSRVQEMDITQLHGLLYVLGWSGFHPDDYDPTSDQLLALVAQVREDTLRAVCEFVDSDACDGGYEGEARQIERHFFGPR